LGAERMSRPEDFHYIPFGGGNLGERVARHPAIPITNVKLNQLQM
jgi:hypothetical protein